jgi:glycosyltransferase involved in cell wall biosynthesis
VKRAEPVVRVLQVIHQFPPFSSQGSEVYCCNLSKQLREDDDVRVFHVSNVGRPWRRRLERATHAGVPAYHCIDRSEYSRVADWPNEFLRRSFRTVLDEFDPQVVHFHNFVSLGDDLVSMASDRARVVYTLHDFGLICPNSLLLRSDGTLCDNQRSDFFEQCCPTLIRTIGRSTQKRPWIARLPSLARWRLYARQSSRHLVRSPLLAGVGLAERWLGNPRETDVARKRDFFLTHRQRIFHDVDLFLAPSRFLLDRYVNCGLPREKVVFARYGMRDISRIARSNGSQPVRVGYIGALHPHKGVEVLLEAFRGLGGRASLHVYGSAFGSPVSQSYLRRIRDGETGNVVFHGSYDNDAIAEVLAKLDVVVVPSLWYENSPLTIQEAFSAGVPVITSDCGGMAELVRHGVDGLRFQMGDAQDLRQKLLQVLDHPELLERFRSNIPEVATIRQHATELRACYQRLLN